MLGRRQLGVVGAAVLFALGCHSPGQYGHSRAYSPLDAEEEAVANAKELDPVMAQRAPDKWRGKDISLFGVVLQRKAGQDGSADLKLSVRTLAPRNLCDNREEDSCRVTVSDRQHGIVHVLLKLEADDDIGRLSVGAGSLLRVVGRLSDDVDGEDGSMVLKGSYYRHWPRGFYVSNKDSSHMRR